MTQAIATNTSSMPNPSALPDAYIGVIFDHFEAYYGDLWMTRYGCSELQKVRKIWGEQLAGFSREALAHGLKAASKGSKFPPDPAGIYRVLQPEDRR